MRVPRSALIVAALLALGAAGCSGPSAPTTAPTNSATAARPEPTAPTTTSGPATTGADTTATDTTATDTTAAPTATPDPPTAHTTPAPAVSLRTVPLEPGVTDEASGIAASGTRPGAYFLVDDGTGTADLAVVDDQGTLLTRVELDGMSASNAEALSAGGCGPIPLSDGAASTCLYVGDIGDNKERRDDMVVFRAPEPDLADANPDVTIEVPAEEWHFVYPDGAHNAESMTVTPDGAIIVVTKPTNNAAHRMYRGEPGGGELAFVREFQVPGSTRPMRTILTGNVATDLFAAPGRVLLLTYDDVHEYLAPDPGADPTTFPDWPVRSLPFPQLPQAEGITGTADGCGYVVASEAGPRGTAGSLGFATCR